MGCTGRTGTPGNEAPRRPGPRSGERVPDPADRCFHRARTTTPPDGGVAPPEAVSIDRTPQRSTRRANGGDAHRPHLVALAQRARAHLP